MQPVVHRGDVAAHDVERHRALVGVAVQGGGGGDRGSRVGRRRASERIGLDAPARRVVAGRGRNACPPAQKTTPARQPADREHDRAGASAMRRTDVGPKQREADPLLEAGRRRVDRMQLAERPRQVLLPSDRAPARAAFAEWRSTSIVASTPSSSSA